MVRRRISGSMPCTLAIVQADDDRAVERHLVDELDEGGADVVERRVVVQVLAIDVGDHGDDRRELQEGAVALVGFHHQEIAVAHARVRAAHGADAAAHHHRRIEPGVVQNGGGHARWWWSCRGCRPPRCRTSGASARPAVRRAGSRGSAGGAPPALRDSVRPPRNSPPARARRRCWTRRGLRRHVHPWRPGAR